MKTHKHVFMKLRFTHPKSIWFSILKIPNFIILSISSILFNAFLFFIHMINNLLNKMFLIHVLHAKTSFHLTHIFDRFKRAYHSLSDFSPKGKKLGVLWHVNGICRL